MQIITFLDNIADYHDLNSSLTDSVRDITGKYMSTHFSLDAFHEVIHVSSTTYYCRCHACTLLSISETRI